MLEAVKAICRCCIDIGLALAAVCCLGCGDSSASHLLCVFGPSVRMCECVAFFGYELICSGRLNLACFGAESLFSVCFRGTRGFTLDNWSVCCHVEDVSPLIRKRGETSQQQQVQLPSALRKPRWWRTFTDIFREEEKHPDERSRAGMSKSNTQLGQNV